MDKKSRLEEELRLTEAGRKFLENVEPPKHTNPLPPKVNDKVKPYKKVNTIIIPEGATNGDVIKDTFNCMVIDITNGKVYVENIYFPFDEDWWNAPYKGVEK